MLVTAFVVLDMLVLAAAGMRAAAVLMASLAGCWTILVVAESVRLARLTPRALRIALAFCTIHGGLVLGFWRGILEFRRFQLPWRNEP